MVLRSNVVGNSRELCTFVNSSGIKKEDIQNIVWTNGSYTIFYWE